MSDRFERVTGAAAGWLDHATRGRIVARGRDRARFLNGMLSNDVEALESGRGCWATLLDRKGHVLSDLEVVNLGESILLDTAAGTGAAVLEILDKHVVADDVEFEDHGASWGSLSFEGPGARAFLSARAHPAPEPDRAEVDDEDRVWLGGGALSDEGVRVYGPADRLDGLCEGLSRIDDGAAEILRVERAIPRYGVDVGPRNFPLEARMDAAISDTKGCYIGQEIIARLISRGAVNRFLVPLAVDGDAEPGDEIRAGRTRVGQVTSVVRSPDLGTRALGYVRRAESEPGTELEIGGVAARVLDG